MSENEENDDGAASVIGALHEERQLVLLHALVEFRAALIDAEAHFDKRSPEATRESWRLSLDAIRALAIRLGMGTEGFGQLAYLHAALEDLEGGRVDQALKPVDRSGEGKGGRPVTSADRGTDLAMVVAVIDILIEEKGNLDEAVRHGHSAAKAGSLLPDGMTAMQLKNWRRQIDSKSDAARLTRRRIVELIKTYPAENRVSIALDLLRRWSL